MEKYLPKCYEELLNKIPVLCGTENIFGCPQTKQQIKVEGRLQILLLSSEKRSNAIREIIYFVVPGNVCNESQNNNASFQGSYEDSMVRWCEI
jgi:hypothetical protein